ncbi:MAG: signal peptidase II [bacterium]|nr:signal peptidase II [bacterium]
MLKKKKVIFGSVITAIIIIIIDQISKLYIRHHIPLNSNIDVIKGFFHIVNVTNKGIAFGLMDNFSTNRPVLFILITIFSIIVLVYFYVLFIKEENHSNFIVFSLAGIIGGAFGNFIDRLILGYVTDFILIHYKNFSWPAFNIADTCISVGAVGLIIFLIFTKEPKEESENGGYNA